MNESTNHPRTAADQDSRTVLKQAIRRQMNQGGNILLCGLEPLSDEEFFAASSSGASAAWTVGHLACVFDLFTSWIAARPPVFEKRQHDVFNSLQIGKSAKSKAEATDCGEFSKTDIILMFRQAQVRALEVLERFDVSLWDAPTPRTVPETLPTYGAIWESLGVHTFWHLGELSGSIPRFHGTYTLNTVVHYFYVPPPLDYGSGAAAGAGSTP